MNWYLAKFIFHIITTGNHSAGQFEEKLRLITGEHLQDALQKASVWGEQEEVSFINASGKEVRWEFIAVSELKLLSEFTDGLELDSHLSEMPAVEEFIALQREKHTRLFLNAEEPHTV